MSAAWTALSDEEWAAVLASVRRDPAPLLVPGEWTEAQHAASLAGDRDPDVVAGRRIAATGLSPTHPDIRRNLPRSLP